MSKCFVYIIAMHGGRLRKIGISSSPASRLSQLRTASPFPVEMERIYPFPSRVEAATIERAFHRTFADRRMSGEWFRLDMGSAQNGVNVEISRSVASAGRLSESERHAGMEARGLSADEAAIYDFDLDAVA